jgi:hypothetical protein
VKGNYKVRVRVPIYAMAEIDYMAFEAEDEAAAIAEAQGVIGPGDVAMWFTSEWNPRRPLPSLAEVIEFEATETDPPNEKEKSTE